MSRDRSSVPVVLESGGAGMTVRDTVIRHAVFVWSPLLVVLVTGLVAHAVWGHSPMLPLITACEALSAAGLALGTWHLAAKHKRHGGPHAAGTIIAAGLWLVLVTMLGWSSFTGTMWGLVGPVLCLSWSLRVALARAPKDGQGQRDPKSPKELARALLGSLGVKGADMQILEANATRIAGALEVDGSSTIDDVQKRGHQLAAAIGAPRAGVRINADPNNAGRGEFSLALRDVLAETTPWPGPAHVGGTPWDPIPMGLYETGAVVVKTVGNATGAKHELVQGMTGSGKSSGSKVEIGELMSRRETQIIVIDTEKGIQTFGAAAPGLALFVVDKARAVRLVKRLRTHVLKERGKYLGARGLAAWQPGCGLTWVHVQIEEAGNFLADGETEEDLKALVKALRSVGVKLELSLQRPSHDEIDTTLRSQFGTVSCYGMSPDDPICLLPDEVVEAGADPRRWRDTQPGCNYLAGTGISTAQASTPLRTYDLADAVMAAHAATYGPRMDPMDPVTARSLGSLWTDREIPADMVARIKAEALAGHPELAAGTTTPTSPADAGEDDDDMEPDASVTPEEMGATAYDDDPEIESPDDLDAPLDEVDDIPFGEPAPARLPTEDARKIIADHIAALDAAGETTVRATHTPFKELVVQGAVSRPWVRKELKRLVTIGRLSGGDGGEFTILPTDGDSDDGEAAA